MRLGKTSKKTSSDTTLLAFKRKRSLFKPFVDFCNFPQFIIVQNLTLSFSVVSLCFCVIKRRSFEFQIFRKQVFKAT
jgi:hypothetical protein